MKKRIAVFFGGKSVEHDISILSALQTYPGFDEDRFEVILVYLNRENQAWVGESLKNLASFQDLRKLMEKCHPVHIMSRGKQPLLKYLKFPYKEILFDIAFPIVHGQGMEDGTLRGFFDFLQIPTVGSSQVSSGIAQDKVLTKKILENANIPQIPYFWFYGTDLNLKKDWILSQAKLLGYPLIIKPAHLGSSIGIHILNTESQWEEVVEWIVKLDTKLLVEKALIDFREFNCAVLGSQETTQPSLIEEVTKTGDILSFNDKYLHSEGNTMALQPRVLPAKIEEKMKIQIEALAKGAFQTLGASGVARIDFLFDNKSQQLFFNEINMIPGSLSYYLWEKKGLLLPQLLDELIRIAEQEIHQNDLIVHSFETAERELLFQNKLFQNK